MDGEGGYRWTSGPSGRCQLGPGGEGRHCYEPQTTPRDRVRGRTGTDEGRVGSWTRIGSRQAMPAGDSASLILRVEGRGWDGMD
eukprot:835635-Rhodomonas_salina.1